MLRQLLGQTIFPEDEFSQVWVVSNRPCRVPKVPIVFPLEPVVRCCVGQTRRQVQNPDQSRCNRQMLAIYRIANDCRGKRPALVDQDLQIKPLMVNELSGRYRKSALAVLL